jgi:hypothetical protein
MSLEMRDVRFVAEHCTRTAWSGDAADFLGAENIGGGRGGQCVEAV